MKITRAGTNPSTKGPGDWFTGTVRIDPLFQAEAARGTYEEGAIAALCIVVAGLIPVMLLARSQLSNAQQ